MLTPHTIYGLIDPRNTELYYVGQTRRALVERTDEHFFTSGDSLVSKRNRAILQCGMVPGIVKLAEAADARAAFHAELYWIHFLVMQGKRLLNREAQPWFIKQYKEIIDRRRLETVPKRLSKPPRKHTARIPPLRKGTYARAADVVPGEEIHALEQEWRAWITKSGRKPPEHPDAAFLAFCKKRSTQETAGDTRRSLQQRAGR